MGDRLHINRYLWPMPFSAQRYLAVYNHGLDLFLGLATGLPCMAKKSQKARGRPLCCLAKRVGKMADIEELFAGLYTPRPTTQYHPLQSLGIIIWGIGFWFESTADKQLKYFLKHRKSPGQIMQTGLWKYSRHPNYFGEAVQWWGIGIMATTVEGGAWGLLGPLTITVLLTKVSGIPLLEKGYANNDEYQKYKHRTNAFIPGRPR
jgi:protein-S-isoprenylcysteine O-methyltransferase Ste14